MAPILKEADASLPTASSAPAPAHSKPASEPARPQPVALEIPVTVNGARTIDGSEKRVPFSESTQTVLVFPHGAVVRIATPLAAGQLVFLTNEKSKKEVVCQVVKSKSTGGAAAYVELQFTEASAGFWGLQVPGSSTVPSSSRPGPVSMAPKVVAPTSAAAKPVAPSVPPVSQQAPVPSNVQPTAPPVAAVPPVIQDRTPVAPSASADIKSPIPSAPVPPAAHHPAQPPSPLHDYSKQIEALFVKPQPPIAPSVSDSHPTPVAPSTDELKQQAARLQEQLSSLLFTESHLAQPASPSAPASKSQKPVIPSDLGSTEGKPASPMLAVDEEVKIPSWLAPLSQNAEATVASDSPEKSEVAHDASTVVTSEESHEALEASTNHAQAGVFGGQLLGESAAPAAEGVSSGSKKGLLIGIAATVLIAGGAWYFYQNRSVSTPVTRAPATNAAPSSSPAPFSNSPSSSAASTPAANNEISSSAPASQPARKNTPSAASAVPLGEAQPRESRPALKTPEAVEEAPKPALGGVHLAAPVVSHSSNSQSDAPALPSIDANSVSAAGDALAAAAAAHDAPAAPLPVGGDVQQARLLKSVAPQYPAIAKAQRISGKVQIDALIDKSGNVANTKVISGPPLLYGAAVEAVKQWKYSPALLDGQPTSMHLTVTVEFRAQ